MNLLEKKEKEKNTNTTNLKRPPLRGKPNYSMLNCSDDKFSQILKCSNRIWGGGYNHAIKVVKKVITVHTLIKLFYSCSVGEVTHW